MENENAVLRVLGLEFTSNGASMIRTTTLLLACLAILFSGSVEAQDKKTSDPLLDSVDKTIEEATPKATPGPGPAVAPRAGGEPRIPSLDELPKPGTPRPTASPSAAASSSKYQALLAGLTVFVLAIFVGFEVIAKVPPTLHTPLMSGSNAISGITIVGAIILSGAAFFGPGKSESEFWRVAGTLVGIVPITLAMTNVVGGFLVTHRMLGMFHAKREEPSK